MSETSRTKHLGRYRKLRMALIHRGLTLWSFALRHGYSVPTVYMAARGERAGVESVKILNHLEDVINDN